VTLNLKIEGHESAMIHEAGTFAKRTLKPVMQLQKIQRFEF
jgi:hypothetical protein